jgi:hypothetical protein
MDQRIAQVKDDGLERIRHDPLITPFRIKNIQ